MQIKTVIRYHLIMPECCGLSCFAFLRTVSRVRENAEAEKFKPLCVAGRTIKLEICLGDSLAVPQKMKYKVIT